MQVVHVPDATLSQQRIDADGVSFVNYRDKGGPFRNRVMFGCCAFSFIQNGQKKVYRAGESKVIDPGYGMLIPEGNSIIIEHSDTTEKYNTILIFFPARVAKAFVATHKSKIQGTAGQSSYVYFATNGYIDEYIRHIKSLIDSQQVLSKEMALLKINELLTAVYEISPALLAGILCPAQSVSLKVVVENNLFNNLTLEELSFLANRSVSSFKRDFEKTYGVPPQRYIRERKLEIACAELTKGRSASDLYMQYGYENLSNFNTAFKRKYGKTPGAFRQHV